MAAKVLLFARQNANQRTKCSPKRHDSLKTEKTLRSSVYFRNLNFIFSIIKFIVERIDNIT